MTLLRFLPATSATAEGSFSALRRTKTYLRATMGQERLNSMVVLNIHGTDTDKLDLVKVALDYVSLNDHRRSLFAQYSCV